jgi:hypothetical protein
MRISLIGPGDTEFHYQELLKISRDELESELERIAKALADSGSEIELLPDNGVSLMIAREYKKSKGKRIIGAYPKSDNTFGVKHLEIYTQEKIDGEQLFDEFVDTENWFKHDLIKGLLGNAILYLGSSPGTNGELNYAVYLYKLMTGNKKGVEVAGKFIHHEIRAGKDFTIFVYSPFLTNGTLKKEDEEYISKFGIRLVYVKNPEQLRDELRKLHM